jgi:hypothetical protein
MSRFASSAEQAGTSHILHLRDNDSLLRLGSGANNRITANDGTNDAFSTNAWNASEAIKIGLAYGGSSMRVNNDGTWGAAASYDGAFTNTANKLKLGAYVVSAPTLFSNLRRYDLDYVAAQAKIDELMT